MHRRFLLTALASPVLAFLLAGSAVASVGSQLWVQRYSTASDDVASAVTYSPDGTRVLVTGTGAGNKIITYAYNAATGAAHVQSLPAGFGPAEVIALALFGRVSSELLRNPSARRGRSALCRG
jgi:hypothetical protein